MELIQLGNYYFKLLFDRLRFLCLVLAYKWLSTSNMGFKYL